MSWAQTLRGMEAMAYVSNEGYVSNTAPVPHNALRRTEFLNQQV